jgi:hypothetical protein
LRASRSFCHFDFIESRAFLPASPSWPVAVGVTVARVVDQICVDVVGFDGGGSSWSDMG